MPRKVRKQIYIDPQHELRLKRLAKKTGVAESEIIRRALDAHLRRPSNGSPVTIRQEAWRETRAFIRRLIKKGPIPGGRTWRREDLHER